MFDENDTDTLIVLEKTYPLTNEPVEITLKEADDPVYDDDKWFVSFGNTGLLLEVYPKNPSGENYAKIHFLPDNKDKPNPGNEPKVIAAGALGLSALVKWYKNYPFDSGDGSLPKFKEVMGTTNETMNVVGKGLGEDIYTEDMGGEEQFYFHMNLEKLCGKNEAVARIQKIADRGKRQNYFMTEPPSRKSTG